MKIANTPLESIRIKWTLTGLVIAVAAQGLLVFAQWLQGRAVVWSDVLPTMAAVFAVLFAVQGAVYDVARLPKE
jgi:multidrug resistance efflux pump